ncbi:MAG: hypothetical protein ABUK01_12260 [Leptospirales bacterium]
MVKILSILWKIHYIEPMQDKFYTDQIGIKRNKNKAIIYPINTNTNTKTKTKTKTKTNIHLTISWNNKSNNYDLHLKNEKTKQYIPLAEFAESNYDLLIECLPSIFIKYWKNYYRPVRIGWLGHRGYNIQIFKNRLNADLEEHLGIDLESKNIYFDIKKMNQFIKDNINDYVNILDPKDITPYNIDVNDRLQAFKYINNKRKSFDLYQRPSQHNPDKLVLLKIDSRKARRSFDRIIVEISKILQIDVEGVFNDLNSHIDLNEIFNFGQNDT